MRMILEISFPHEPFNGLVRKGTVGSLMQKILGEQKPEAVYFSERDGHRGAILIINVNDSSEIPFFSEAWFLNFNADCRFRILMSPEDLEKAGLDELGKKWG